MQYHCQGCHHGAPTHAGFLYTRSATRAVSPITTLLGMLIAILACTQQPTLVGGGTRYIPFSALQLKCFVLLLHAHNIVYSQHLQDQYNNTRQPDKVYPQQKPTPIQSLQSLVPKQCVHKSAQNPLHSSCTTATKHVVVCGGHC